MTRNYTAQLAHTVGISLNGHAWILSALLLLIGIFLIACSGGGGSGSASDENGTVLIGLTDADGDFTTYTVDVMEIKLTRADGAVVDALPVQTRVDFAQYTDMTEFLNVATVPLGVYTHVDMTLDYTNADIRVVSGNDALSLTPEDSSGQPITTLTMQVKLDGNHPLVVRPGVPAHLTLDFDLQATNTVDIDLEIVMVAALLLADVNIEHPKVHRVRGPLADVHPGAGKFVVAIRPFHLLRGEFGHLTVKTGNDTMFEIDRVSYQGMDGLTQLATLTHGVGTVVYGDFNMGTRTFHATEVYAGSSVAYGRSDVVTGSVMERNGNTLTVCGVTLVRTDGTLLFRDKVTVSLDASAKVLKQMSGMASIDDVSVGSRITAIGTISGDLQTNPLLDTTNGLVRIMFSSVAGNVNQIDTGLVTMNLQSINGRPAAIYNFSDTGMGGADSNPAAYRVATGDLNLGSLATNDPMRVRGFVTSFGQADTHDFDAQTLIELSDVPAWMGIAWFPAQPSPFTSLSNQAIVTDITGSLLHHVFQRAVATDLTTLSGNPTLQPFSEGTGHYAIVHKHSIRLYHSFARFSEALTKDLSAAHRVWGVGARGSFDHNSVTLTSRLAVVHLQ